MRWSMLLLSAWPSRTCWPSWSRARPGARPRAAPPTLEQADLELAARYINDNFRGWMMEDVRRELARRIQQERSEYDRLMRSVEQLYSRARWRPKEGPPRSCSWKARPTS